MSLIADDTGVCAKVINKSCRNTRRKLLLRVVWIMLPSDGTSTGTANKKAVKQVIDVRVEAAAGPQISQGVYDKWENTHTHIDARYIKSYKLQS